MLEIKRITSVIKTYDYGVINKIYLTFNNGKEYKVMYSSDNFVGYNFTDIKIIFKRINGILDKLIPFQLPVTIKAISNLQHFLVNKKMQSTIFVEYSNGNKAEYNVSDLFQDYENDIDFYILAHDMVLNICKEISEAMNGKQQKNGIYEPSMFI